MTTKGWSFFSDFDVKAWEQDVPQSADAVHGLEGWKKPLWTPHSASKELPERSVAPRSAGNPWILTQTISRKSSVIPALQGGVEGLRFAKGLANDSWLEGVHLDMIRLELDANEIKRKSFELTHWKSASWKGTCGLFCESMTAANVAEHLTLWAEQKELRRWTVDGGRDVNRVNRAVNALRQLDRARDVYRSLDLDASAEWSAFQWRWESGVHALEEVAFLRAIRFVWERWLEENSLDSVPIWIDARTSEDFMIESQPTDHFVGLTSATYAAAMGGADSIETLPHDLLAASPSEDGLRWARNIQHLMREESHLHATFDPMGGSRVIEAWTHSIVDAIWAAYSRSNATAP